MIKVLFVCVHNAGRSQMAEAFTNLHGGGAVRALSAGTLPGNTLNPVVVQAMTERGIDIATNQPKVLDQSMIDEVDRIYTMGCAVDESCPISFTPSEDWGLPDPAGEPIEIVRLIRDDIERRVKTLLHGLQAGTIPVEPRKY